MEPGQTGSPEIFATLDDYFSTQRTRALEVFREFDQDRSGVLDERNVMNLLLRLVPSLDRKDTRYVRNMVQVTGIQQIGFLDLSDLIKQSRLAAETVRAQPSATEALRRKMRALLPARPSEAARAMQQFATADHRRAQNLDHGEVVKMIRSFHPGVDSFDARLVLAALYCIDWEGTGSIGMEELMDLVAVSDEGVVTNASRTSGGSLPYTAAAHQQAYAHRDASPAGRAEDSGGAGPVNAKEDLRRAVEMHKEHEGRLKAAMRGAQECMAVDADELRRDLRRLEAFDARLGALATQVEDSGRAVQEGLKQGFDVMQAVLVERAQSLLTQAADVTAERLAMVRAQSERTGKTMEEVKRVVGLAESALEEKDAVTVMALNEKFEAAITNLHDSGRLRMLEPCTNEDHGLVVDFEGAKEELQETLEFARPSEGVAGPLRGAAAMKLLREVYSGLDKEGKGLISKAALLAALRSEPKVADLLKMPLITDQSYNNAGPAETFEDTFRKIDVDSSDNLSWPEFASYFGKSYLHFAGLPSTAKKTRGANKAALAKEVERLHLEMEGKLSMIEESTRESERLAILLEQAETFAAQQASQHEEQTKQLQHEKQALQKEFEAKLKSIEAENAARQADFEARLQSALQRSEAVLTRDTSIRKQAETPPLLPTAPSYPTEHQPRARGEVDEDDLDIRSEKSMEESMAKIKASNNRPSSAHANRRTSIDLSKPQLYNNRAVGRNEDKSAVPLRLQQAGQRANNRR